MSEETPVIFPISLRLFELGEFIQEHFYDSGSRYYSHSLASLEVANPEVSPVTFDQENSTFMGYLTKAERRVIGKLPENWSSVCLNLKLTIPTPLLLERGARIWGDYVFIGPKDLIIKLAILESKRVEEEREISKAVSATAIGRFLPH